jgi:hypothetical protein
MNTDSPIICGGDWNTTYSNDGGNSNIDIINMQNPPSLIRSGWLSGICNDFNLFDPFRTLYPTRRDFTFILRTGAKNRSRIDFFLIAGELLSICNKCTISASLNTDLFDHKSITMDFNISKVKSKHFINPSTFNHPRFNAVVATAVVETYLQHAVVDQQDVDIEEGLLHVGRLIAMIKKCNNIDFSLAFEGICEDKKKSIDYVQ